MAALPLLLTAAAVAQPPAAPTSTSLPRKIAALVPEGTRLTNQTFAAAPTLASADFNAERKLPEGRTTYYSFSLNAYDSAGPLWTMRKPVYQAQVTELIAKELKSTDAAPSTTADPPSETKYAWGSGVKRRVVHHVPRAKNYFDYNCSYFGIAGGVRFDLRVTRVPDSCGAADQWAAAVAAQAANLSVSNIADK
jgi:hypothetical protein